MSRVTNPAGQAIIKDAESLKLVGYLCPAGKPTVGWGHTGPDVRVGMTITRDQAVALFNRDLEWAEECVETSCKIPPNDNQFSAMVSLCFNLGVPQFKSSSVLRLHNAGKFDQAAASFALWNKAMVDGQLVVMPGLVIRRAKEAALYMTPDVFGDVSRPVASPPMPQAVEPPKSVATSKSVVTGVVGGVAGVGAVADQVAPAIDAVRSASDAAAGAATSMGAAKAALGSLIDGRALPVVLMVLAVGCIAFVVWRYIIKARRGEVVSS